MSPRPPNDRRQGGIPPPKHPAAEPEFSFSPAPVPRVSLQPRSHDSFPALSDQDRALMQRVLTTAQQAMKESKDGLEREARERATLEGQLKVQLAEMREEVGELRQAVTELKGIHGDMRGLRGDVSTLNANLMLVLNSQASDERRFGELGLKMERQVSELSLRMERQVGDTARTEAKSQSKTTGAKFGAIVGGLISVTSAIIAVAYMIAYVNALYNASPPPVPPTPPKAVPTAQ